VQSAVAQTLYSSAGTLLHETFGRSPQSRLMSEDGIQDAQELTGGGGDVLGLLASIASRASAMYVAARDSLSLADSRASSHEGNRSGAAPNTPPVPRIVRRVSERRAVTVSRQTALDPTSIQRARAAAGYHGEEQNQEQSASTGTSSISAVVQHTGLASSDAARNNLADEMEEDSRSKKKRKMGTKPTCIREQHDAAVRNARFQLLKAFAKYSDMISRENALPTDPRHAATLTICCEIKMSPNFGGKHGKKLRLDKPEIICVGHNRDSMKWVTCSFAEANGSNGRKRAGYNKTVLLADEGDGVLTSTIETHIASHKNRRSAPPTVASDVGITDFGNELQRDR
jgi:hypothetical protein